MHDCDGSKVLVDCDVRGMKQYHECVEHGVCQMHDVCGMLCMVVGQQVWLCL